jgi:hypothetical protein
MWAQDNLAGNMLPDVCTILAQGPQSQPRQQTRCIYRPDSLVTIAISPNSPLGVGRPLTGLSPAADFSLEAAFTQTIGRPGQRLLGHRVRRMAGPPTLRL